MNFNIKNSMNGSGPMDPNAYARQYAQQKGISVEQAKQELRAVHGDPQNPQGNSGVQFIGSQNDISDLELVCIGDVSSCSIKELSSSDYSSQGEIGVINGNSKTGEFSIKTHSSSSIKKFSSSDSSSQGEIGVINGNSKTGEISIKTQHPTQKPDIQKILNDLKAAGTEPDLKAVLDAFKNSGQKPDMQTILGLLRQLNIRPDYAQINIALRQM